MTTALLIIDLQNDYFEGGKYPLEGTEAAAANAAALIAAFRAHDMALIHIRHEILRTPPPFFAPGSKGAEIHESVMPRDGEAVITKNFPNSFRETDLARRLEGIDDLVICGAMSHFCIDATTRAAADAGFGCTVAHDACATRALAFNGVETPAAQVHAAFMAALAAGYAQVLPTKDIVAAL